VVVAVDVSGLNVSVIPLTPLPYLQEKPSYYPLLFKQLADAAHPHNPYKHLNG